MVPKLTAQNKLLEITIDLVGNIFDADEKTLDAGLTLLNHFFLFNGTSIIDRTVDKNYFSKVLPIFMHKKMFGNRCLQGLSHFVMGSKYGAKKFIEDQKIVLKVIEFLSE